MERIPLTSISLKHKPEFYFMKVSMDFDKTLQKDLPEINAALFKFQIIQSARKVFGDVGASQHFDVLSYNNSTRSAILRISCGAFVQLWASVTFVREYEGHACRLTVRKVSTCLPSLCHNSRTYQHNIVQLTNGK